MKSDEDEDKLEREYETLAFLKEKAQELQVKGSDSTAKKVSLTLAREQLFLERLEGTIQKVFKNKIVPGGYSVKKVKKATERIVNVLLSDLHFHSLLDPRELPMAYGAVEEARRLGAITQQVAEYKRQYREETTLYMHILGDIIQGQLYDMRDGAPLAEQCSAAIYLLVQSIQYLASQFPKVVVFTNPGNHGRNTARHQQRATNQKWDSIETIIYYAIKMACKSLPNVTVNMTRQPYYAAKAFNKMGFYTHGDTVINPGYPGKAINVESVRKQINEINAGAVDRGDQEYSLFAVGHVHVGNITHLPNGAIFMSNGCLIPPDGYATSLGIFETATGQQIWESVQDHIVGDARFATVDKHTDKDSSLDKIIKPFTDF
jgi:hypothetical protein